jgi:hypothetical protein
VEVVGVLVHVKLLPAQLAAVPLLAAKIAATRSVGALVWTLALIATAAVVVGQPLQRSPDLLPVAPAAGGVAAGLGAQQPTRIYPMAAIGGRRIATATGKRCSTGQAAAPGRPVGRPAGGCGGRHRRPPIPGRPTPRMLRRPVVVQAVGAPNELAFPNGMVITPGNETLVVAESFAARLTAFEIATDGTLSNRRVWADGVGPDGICLDADGCIWASSANMANDCARIREGGEVLERIDLGRPCFAAMLGGPDRRTLFMLTADWRGTEGVEDVVKARTGRVLVVDAPAAGVGWP